MTDAIERTIEQLSEEAKRFDPTDYLKDGLYFCSKCNTPKQTYVKLFGSVRKVNCMCKCRMDEIDAQQKKDYAQMIENNRKEAFRKCGSGDWTFANDNGSSPELTEAMEKYMSDFSEMRDKGLGLLLYGSTGTGKSFAACQVANALIEKGYKAKVANMRQLVGEMGVYREAQTAYIDELSDYVLLVIDDFGVERDTPYMLESMYNIINGRILSKLPMIITTNLSAEQLKKEEDINFRRTYSRIIEYCHPICVKGEDKRVQIAKARYGEMKDKLGI